MTRERLSVLAVLVAMALAVLDAGAVNVALPLLANEFDAVPSDAVLVVAAYQLAILAGLLPCAHAAESVGYRRLFVTGVALFAAGALACALVPSLPLLVCARFLQGLGSAAIMALGIALLRHALAPERFALAIGWNALIVALCSAAGPAIGAALVSLAGWRWLFLADLPIAALALLAAPALPAVVPTRRRSDRTAIMLYAAAVTLPLAAWHAAARAPSAAVAIGGACIALLAALVRRDLPRRTPFIPLDLLALRPVRISVMASVCCFAAQSAGLVALPFYLLGPLRQGPLAAGLMVTCWPLSVAVTSALANRYLRRSSQPVQCVAGGSILAIGLLASSLVPASETLLPLTAGVALCGIGFGLFQLANNRTLFLGAPSRRAAAAGGLQGTARLTGQTAGTSIAALVLAAMPLAGASRAAFAIGAGFAVSAALASALRSGTAEATPSDTRHTTIPSGD